MKTFFLSDRGKVRQHNEDNGGVFYNGANQVLAVVADGMGGHQAGDVASKMATELIQKYWEDTTSIQTPEEAEKWLKSHIILVNEQLFQHSKAHPECEGMGTTLVVAVISDEFITIAHIGDSRCYTVENKSIQLSTEDHSLVNELVRSGQISREDAEFHPRKNVLLRALGTDLHAQIDVKTVSNDTLTYLLLCSDGLSNKVTCDEILEGIVKDVPIDEKGSTLVSLANQNGGEDNITLILIDLESVQTESGGR
ncbi:Stp1/IreP family PP2C-type Ser/Thr phosphatase [Bacillus pinisoli]|uniref:Stp1/IreP family PP2C-type Ser/Thr phosphatase n=1 Tax=Bacillus pinisoli TaxID=2901866 RepID=UPI001FF10A36|nr:Stp1/IreP family PP2C-type Ser/Thr phosphatase [Bacillus pinisoli]